MNKPKFKVTIYRLITQNIPPLFLKSVKKKKKHSQSRLEEHNLIWQMSSLGFEPDKIKDKDWIDKGISKSN